MLGFNLTKKKAITTEIADLKLSGHAWSKPFTSLLVDENTIKINNQNITLPIETSSYLITANSLGLYYLILSKSSINSVYTLDGMGFNFLMSFTADKPYLTTDYNSDSIYTFYLDTNVFYYLDLREETVFNTYLMEKNVALVKYGLSSNKLVVEFNEI